MLYSNGGGYERQHPYLLQKSNFLIYQSLAPNSVLEGLRLVNRF
jgi:hypothetical protein